MSRETLFTLSVVFLRANDAVETPLMVCARQNSVECARVLVEEAQDLDPNWTDRERRTALILAVQHGHDHMVQVLVGNNGMRGFREFKFFVFFSSDPYGCSCLT